jgi:hypothetical protein
MARRKPIQKGAVRVIFAPLNKRHQDSEEKARKLKIWGLTLIPGRTIFLDPRVRFVDTIIHELLHVRNPGWTEKEVVAETKTRMEQMTWKEKARLLRDVCSAALLEGEDNVRKDSKASHKSRCCSRARR